MSICGNCSSFTCTLLISIELQGLQIQMVLKAKQSRLLSPIHFLLFLPLFLFSFSTFYNDLSYIVNFSRGVQTAQYSIHSVRYFI